MADTIPSARESAIESIRAAAVRVAARMGLTFALDAEKLRRFDPDRATAPCQACPTPARCASAGRCLVADCTGSTPAATAGPVETGLLPGERMQARVLALAREVDRLRSPGTIGVPADVFREADAARTAHLRDIDANDQIGALDAAIAAAFRAHAKARHGHGGTV